MEAFTIAEDKAASIPAGAYQAKFIAYKDIETKNGPTLIWEFLITSGEFNGKTAVAWTDPPAKTKPTTKNHLGVILAGLSGKPLAGGDVFHPINCVGKDYTIMVAPGTKGGACQVRQVAPPMA